MQAAPNNWDSLWSAPHKFEWQFIIDGVTYSSESIQGTPIINRPMMESPSVGQCCTGDLSVTIRKKADHAIPKAASVVAQFRLVSRSDSSVKSDWATAGHYWIANRSGSGNLLSLVCRDALIFAGRTYLDRTQYTEWPIAMKDAAEEIVSLMGIEMDSRTVIKTGPGYFVSYPNEDGLMSDVLSGIAAANGGNFIVTPENKLRLVPFPENGTPVQELGGAFSSYTPLSVGEREVSRVTLNDDADNQFTVGSDGGIEITAVCNYATNTSVKAFSDWLIGRKFFPYVMSGARINPLMELGDTFTATYKGESLTLIANTILLSCSAHPSAEVSNYADEDDEEEIPYIPQSERKASRYVVVNGGYFGNRINRKEGFVSEHIDADGAPDARAILNSGMLALQQKGANGDWINCIYYDTVEKCYKISGTVEVTAQESDASRVWIQDTEPEVGRSKDLWIDTTDGANTPKQWDGEKWVSVSDSLATEAKKIADDAKGIAETANGTASGLLTRVSDVESKITATAIVNAVRSTLTYTYDSAYGRNYALKTAEGIKFVDRILDGTESTKSKFYSLSPNLYNLASASSATLRGSFQIKRTNVASSGVYLGVWVYYSVEGSTSTYATGYRLRISDTSASGIIPFASTDDDWVTCKFNLNMFQYNPSGFVSIVFSEIDAASDTTGTIQIRNVKVELGNSFTDWCPAPEDTADMANGIDALNTSYTALAERVRKAELKITDDAIVGTVSSSETYKTLVTNVGNAQTAANNAATAASNAQSTASSAATAAANAQSAANSAASAVSTLETRVSEAELKIKPDAIVSTVTQSTTYQTLVTNVGNAQTAANNAATAASNAQSTASSAQSSVQQLAGEISSKVSAGDIASTINQTAQSVKISANKISLEGIITANGNVKIDASGNITCNSGTFTNGTFTGTLTAGSWVFDSSGSKYSSGGVSVQMTVLSGGSGMVGGGSNMRAFYASSNCDVQYGSDYNYNALIRAKNVKIISQVGSVSDYRSAEFKKIDGANDMTFVCGEAGSIGSSSGNIGCSDQVWDTVYCRKVWRNAEGSLSSREIKKDIVDMPDMGNIIDMFSPVLFRYNWEDESHPIHHGLIYEDVKEFYPEICIEPDASRGESGAMYTGIDYSELITVLLKETQNLRKRVATLEAKGA